MLRRTVTDHRGDRLTGHVSRRECQRLLARRSESAATTSTPPPDQAKEQVADGCRVDYRPLWRRALELAWIAPVVAGVLVGVLAGGAAASLFVCLPAILLSWALGLPWQAGIAMTVGIVLPLALVYGVIRAPQRRAEQLLQARLCGACGYSIESIETSSDGCRVCPECGAAWRVPPQQHVRCPHCDASLANLTLPADGLIECPECESVLKLEASAVETPTENRSPA